MLETIHESHDYIGIKPSIILHPYRDLYKFSPYSFGDTPKSTDNIIQEIDAVGVKWIRFQPVPVYEIITSVDVLCSAYNEIVGRRKAGSLLVDVLSILDFLYTHPFNDGNGCISRSLILPLPHRHDYMVGRHIGIESFIEKTKDSYYAALKQSSEHWHEGKNDTWLFMRYMLGTFLAAYRDFESRVSVVSDMKMAKEERIRKLTNEEVGLFTKSEIIQSCPDIAATTTEKALGEMRREGIVKTVGGGRGIEWCKA